MSLALPDVTASLRAAGVTAGLTPERLLIVGQKKGGTAVSGALVENIQDDNSWDTLFGATSAIAGAIRRARRRNPLTSLAAISVDDAGGATDATGTFVLTGTATEAGQLLYYVGSKKDHEYKIAVTKTATATAIGDLLAAAINADTKSMVTAANVTGTVTLTAVNGGTFGNTIGLAVIGAVAGITSTLTTMTGGATDPTVTGIFDVIGNERFQGIVWQFQEELDEVIDFLGARFNVANNTLDGRAFVGKTDTFANHLTALSPLNSRDLCYNTGKLISNTKYVGPAILEVPFIIQAEFAAIRALRRTSEAVLGSLVIARSARDSFGGPWQNSKPYFNTPFPDLKVPSPGDSFTDVEINLLRDAGGWVVDTNRPGTAVIAGEVVTTYKTDAAGNPDPTFGFLNYVDTATAAREYIVNNTRAQFPQYRATGGALIPQVDSANEASIAAFVAQKNSELADLALVNSGIGSVNRVPVDYDKLFLQNLTVSLNPVTGKFFVSAKLYIVVQLRGVTYDLAVAFEI
jgi:phage tail sheath gpL-like